jgi:DNA polymerase III sliding clamp (beta) subunit (PCNA family)
LYKIPPDDVSDIESDSPMLIQAALLDQISKIINKDEALSFTYDDESEKVFIAQKNLRIRLASTEKDNIDKFPNIKMLLEKQYTPLTSLPKYALTKVLISASLVNNESALFNFDKEKEELIVKAISEDNKYKPNISNCGAPSLRENVNVVWGVSHLIDGLKIIKNDEIDLQIPDNLRSVKILGKDDENLMYFAMAIDNPKYAEETA